MPCSVHAWACFCWQCLPRALCPLCAPLQQVEWEFISAPFATFALYQWAEHLEPSQPFLKVDSPSRPITHTSCMLLHLSRRFTVSFLQLQIDWMRLFIITYFQCTISHDVPLRLSASHGLCWLSSLHLSLIGWIFNCLMSFLMIRLLLWWRVPLSHSFRAFLCSDASTF